MSRRGRRVRWAERLSGSTLFRAAVVLLAFSLVIDWTRRYWFLPPTAYGGPSILGSALARPSILATVLGIALLAALRGRRSGWEAMEGGQRVRLFVMVPVLIFAWTYSTYDVNEFFGQPHTLDRLLLVALGLGVWLHPLVLLPFYLQTSLILGQLLFPLPGGDWHWPDKQLPWQVLGISAVFCGLHGVIRQRARTLLVAVLLVVGSTYVNAAVGKVTFAPDPLAWALENRLSNISVGAYTNGRWLRGLDPDALQAFWHALDVLQPAVGLGTLAVEAGGLLLFLSRPNLVIGLLAFVALHVSILATTGIFFWKWIPVDLAVAGLAMAEWRSPGRSPPGDAPRGEGESDGAAAEPSTPGARSPWRGGVVPGEGRWLLFAASVVFMLFGRGLLDLNPFTWFDSRVSNFFEMEATGVSGATYRVDARFFAPYDVVTRQSRFYFLVDGPVLAGTYATIFDWNAMEALEQATPATLPALRERYGANYFHPEAATRFGLALRTFLDNAMERGSRRWVPLVPKPPYHFQATMSEDTYRFQEPLTEMRVYFEEWFRSEDGPLRTRRRRVLTVPLEGPVVLHAGPEGT